jgi:hypothetical protein
MTVSHDLDPPMTISQEMLALFIENNDPDALTDILVESLEDALRILQDEIGHDTVH